MRLILFGPPGVGKGTQARLIQRRRGLVQISTGEILRAAIKAGTPLGVKASRYMNFGRLVPGELIRDLAEEAIADAGMDNFVLDGYPRTLQQARWVDAFLNQHGAEIELVLRIVVPDDVIVDRLSKRRIHKVTGENFHLDFKPPPPEIDPRLIIQRDDDRPEAIKQRLQTYRDETSPVEEHYRKRDIVEEIDGLGTIQEVYDRIINAIDVVRADNPR